MYRMEAEVQHVPSTHVKPTLTAMFRMAESRRQFKLIHKNILKFYCWKYNAHGANACVVWLQKQKLSPCAVANFDRASVSLKMLLSLPSKGQYVKHHIQALCAIWTERCWGHISGWWQWTGNTSQNIWLLLLILFLIKTYNHVSRALFTSQSAVWAKRLFLPFSPPRKRRFQKYLHIFTILVTQFQ